MKFNLLIDGQNYDIELRKGRSAMVWVGNETFQAVVKKSEEGILVVLDDKEFLVKLNGSHVSINGHKHAVEVRNLRRGRPTAHKGDGSSEYDAQTQSGEGTIYPPMPGRIIAIKVKEGDEVKIGSPLLILEAMKMQNEISSPVDGTVKEVRASEGSLVEAKDVLIVIG
jgi:biotin carboxyl carrier protein